MKVLGINHIGIAAKDPQRAQWFFREVLGLPFHGDELVKEQKTMTHMFAASTKGASFPDSRLEIVANHQDEDGPIKKFIETRGGGIHHIALAVDDVKEAISHIKRHDVVMIDEVPRAGAHNTQIAFVHPKSTGGVLIELVQEAST
ncbi:MAG: methylmalonyl-CoA epimerase [Pseudobacteriovorax sp.]|nr:methylmalonyl-CoA epimerase [Pseudobacteriovorax sp.]